MRRDLFYLSMFQRILEAQKWLMVRVSASTGTVDKALSRLARGDPWPGPLTPLEEVESGEAVCGLNS